MKNKWTSGPKCAMRPTRRDKAIHHEQEPLKEARWKTILTLVAACYLPRKVRGCICGADDQLLFDLVRAQRKTNTNKSKKITTLNFYIYYIVYLIFFQLENTKYFFWCGGMNDEKKNQQSSFFYFFLFVLRLCFLIVFQFIHCFGFNIFLARSRAASFKRDFWSLCVRLGPLR